MLFLKCLSSVTDWTAWKHADDAQKCTEDRPLYTPTSRQHPFTVYPTSTTLHNTQIKHTQTQCMSKEGWWVCAHNTAPVSLKGVGERISCIFSPCFQAWIHILSRVPVFIQASRQIQFNTAHSCAVKVGKEMGDTGHCNEHLWDVSQ